MFILNVFVSFGDVFLVDRKSRDWFLFMEGMVVWVVDFIDGFIIGLVV